MKNLGLNKLSSLAFYTSILAFGENDTTIRTSILSNENVEKNTCYLYQNYPNPFNPKTNINYELKINSHVNLKIYDIQESK
ncbi:MAG: hypothetical protein ABI840_06225 [bacterium]